MNRLRICALSVLICGSLEAAQVTVSLRSIIGRTNDVALALEPHTGPLAIASDIYVWPATIWTTNGTVTIPDLPPGNLWLSIPGSAKRLLLSVPDTTNTYNAIDITQTNLAYFTQPLELIASTGITIVSNGNRRTISAPGAGVSAADATNAALGVVADATNDLATLTQSTNAATTAARNATNDLPQQLTVATNQSWQFGQEALSAWNTNLVAGLPSVICIAGDSTTAGDVITDARCLPQNVLSNALAAAPQTTIHNDAVTGTLVSYWRDTVLPIQLARNPTLIIERYGINDGSGASNRNAFEAQFRFCLATIRSNFTVAQCSILLVTPQMVNDDVNGRNQAWFNQVNEIKRRAARDYQCAFIDLTTTLASLDSAWMDDWSGVHIHGFNQQSLITWSAVADFLYPRGVERTVGTFQLSNPAYGWQAIAAAATPTNYRSGISMNRANPALGWPYDGQVITFSHVDGSVHQINAGYNNTGVAWRNGLKSPNGWWDWYYPLVSLSSPGDGSTISNANPVVDATGGVGFSLIQGTLNGRTNQFRMLNGGTGVTLGLENESATVEIGLADDYAHTAASITNIAEKAAQDATNGFSGGGITPTNTPSPGDLVQFSGGTDYKTTSNPSVSNLTALAVNIAGGIAATNPAASNHIGGTLTVKSNITSEALLTLSLPGRGTAINTNYGLTLSPSTAAAAGAPQYSPGFSLEGFAWSSNGAASVPMKWTIQNVTANSAGVPTDSLNFYHSTSNGAVTIPFTISTTAIGSYSMYVNPAGFMFWSGRAAMDSPAAGRIRMLSTTAGVGAQVEAGSFIGTNALTSAGYILPTSNGTNYVLSYTNQVMQYAMLTNNAYVTFGDPSPLAKFEVTFNANGADRAINVTTNATLLSTNGWAKSGAFWTNTLPSGTIMEFSCKGGRGTNVNNFIWAATIAPVQ